MPAYYVSCMYDGKKIIPLSSFQARRVVERSGDGRARRRYWQITLGGTCLPTMGSPLWDGSWHTGAAYPADTPTHLQDPQYALAHLRNKLGALHNLFKADGKQFEIVPGDGSAPIKFQPRWGEFSCPTDDSLLVTHAPWSVQCETDLVSPWDSAAVFDQAESPPEESWELAQQDEVGRVWTLTHTAAATGRRRYDAAGAVQAEGWEVARDLITGGPLAGGGATSVLGPDAARVASTGVADLAGFAAYNRRRQETVDEGQGRVQVVETWTLFHPADQPTGLTAGLAVEDYQTETRYGNDTGLTSVTVSGTIAGLDDTNGGHARRWHNAALRAGGITEAWAHGLAQTESGVTLHPNALSTSLGRNKLAGTVTYSATFDNRAAPTTAGVLSYQTTIELKAAADVFASIPIPFRLPGPLLQGMGTVTAKSITVRTDAVCRTTFGAPSTWPTTNHLAKALSYIGVPTQLFVADDTESRTEESGRYSRSTTYIFQ